MSTTENDAINQTNNTSNRTWEPSACARHITANKVHWYQFMAVSAVAFIFLLAWLRRRRRISPTVCGGRPGLPRPLNFLYDIKNRMIIIAGFGVTAWMLQEITIGRMMFGIDDLNKFSAYWVQMLATMLIAIICYPIFGGASSDHTIGYGVGTVYVWLLTVSYVVFNFPCELLTGSIDNYGITEGILKIVEFLPCFVGLSYLSYVYPARLVARSEGRKLEALRKEEELPCLGYVRELLSKRKPEPEVPKSRWKRWRWKIYKPVKGFRYSVSMLTAVFVSMLLVFTVWITLIQLFLLAKGYIFGSPYVLHKFESHDYGDMKMVKKVIVQFIEKTGGTKLAMYISAFVYFCLSAALILSMINLLSTLPAHRQNLLDSYKGKFVSSLYYQRSPRGIVVSSVKFIGYQFAFAIWGLVIQTAVVAILLGGVGGLIFLWFVVTANWATYVREEYLNTSFGFFVNSIVLHVLHHVLAHFVFLQRDEHGKRLLIIDNRSLFTNYYYFMTFPNVLLSVFICLLRLIMATILSMWTLPRLYRSALPRHFEIQALDSAYAAYVGLLRMESTQTNPTMLSFIRLLTKPGTSEKQDRKTTSSHRQASVPPRSHSGSSDRALRKKRIANRWRVIFTLLRNPSLQLLRKRRLIVIHPNKQATGASDSSSTSDQSASSHSI